MKTHNRITLIAAAVLALGLAGGAVALATGHDSDENVTGPGAQRAREAALEVTHGGTANSVELDDENGATWEVEVTKTDGNTVDVRLDENYDLVVIEGDSDSPDDGDSDD